MDDVPARPVRGGPGRWRRTEIYGLLAVCSASKVNVAVVAEFWKPLPELSGKSQEKHRLSVAPEATLRSPASAPWAVSPNAAPSRGPLYSVAPGAAQVPAWI